MNDLLIHDVMHPTTAAASLAVRQRQSPHQSPHQPGRGLVNTLLLCMTCLLLVTLTGCGSKDDAQTLEIFRQKWFAAVNEQQGEALYTMLDSASKRWVSRELDELRGLDKDTQRRVVDQLGGQRADNLMEFTPGQYFGLLWRQATEGRRPTMKVEASGSQTAYIELSLNDTAPQRIRLVIEGGHWVWQLPEADFSVRARQARSAVTP